MYLNVLNELRSIEIVKFTSVMDGLPKHNDLRYIYSFHVWQVRKMTELINSMKLIKMYAWEKPFKSAIQGILLFIKER